MSVTSTNITHSETNQANATVRPSSESSEDIQSLNRLVDRMAKIIPPSPYVPSIPQDDPKYHHSSVQASQEWLHGTPFHADEHPNIQYMTFLYQDPTASCTQLHNMDEYDPSRSKKQTTNTINGINGGTNTLSQNPAPKKKMTFGDYKKKHINGRGSALAQQPAQKRSSDETEFKKESSDSERPSRQTSDEGRTNVDVQPERPNSRVEPRPDSPPAKRRKLSPITDTVTNSKKIESSAPARDPLDLPSSPVSMDIPAIPVSLDLPSFINSELLASEKRTSSPIYSSTPSKAPSSTKTEAQHPATRTDSPLHGQVNGIHSHHTSTNEAEIESSSHVSKQSHAHPVKKAGSLAQDTQVETNSIKTKTTAAAQSRTLDEISTKATKASSPPVTPAKVATDPQTTTLSQKTKVLSGSRENGPRMRKVVRLKVRGKSARKYLANYLRLPPQPWTPEKFKTLLETEPERPTHARTSKSGASKGVRATADATMASETTIKPPEKRPRPNDEFNTQERASKRSKVQLSLDVQNDSTTPEAPTSKSPVPNPSSVPKQIQNTPRKDLKSVAMQRIGSTDSVHTPHGTVQTPPTSGVPEHVTARKNSNSEKERSNWKAETVRLSKLGASLKHNAENKDGKGEKNTRLAAIKMIESFLCFLLAFVCTDNAQCVYNLPPDLNPNTWLSLQKFSSSVLAWVKPYPHLHGLTQQLITVLDSHIAALAVRVPTNQWPSPSMLAETMAQLQHAAASGAHRLPVQELTDKYPQTCKKAVDYLSHIECARPRDYGGEYTVPLNVQSTPLQAVRFGVVFLKEWLQHEKLAYDLELRL